MILWFLAPSWMSLPVSPSFLFLTSSQRHWQSIWDQISNGVNSLDASILGHMTVLSLRANKVSWEGDGRARRKRAQTRTCFPQPCWTSLGKHGASLALPKSILEKGECIIFLESKWMYHYICVMCSHVISAMVPFQVSSNSTAKKRLHTTRSEQIDQIFSHTSSGLVLSRFWRYEIFSSTTSPFPPPLSILWTLLHLRQRYNVVSYHINTEKQRNTGLRPLLGLIAALTHFPFFSSTPRKIDLYLKAVFHLAPSSPGPIFIGWLPALATLNFLTAQTIWHFIMAQGEIMFLFPPSQGWIVSSTLGFWGVGKNVAFASTEYFQYMGMVTQV